MAKRGERICVACGRKYEYCPNCGKGDPAEAWRYMFDSEECRDVFKTCSSFAFGHITAEAAQKKLSKYDLSDKSKFTEDIRRNLSAIYATPVENTEEPKAEAETVSMVAPVGEEKQDNNYRFNKNKKHHNNNFVNK